MSAKQQFADAVAAIPDSASLEDAFQRLYAAFREKLRQEGRSPSVVMLTTDDYERTERERQILLLLARGEREIAAEAGDDLDAVLRDADALLGGSAAPDR